jgi:hypothetical protein
MALEAGDEIAIGTSLVRIEEIGVCKSSMGEGACPGQSG